MAVTLGRRTSGTQTSIGKVASAAAFGVGFRRMVSGDVDGAGSIADIWDRNKGGLKVVEVILFDGAGLPDYTNKTVAGGVYPQRFIAFGR